MLQNLTIASLVSFLCCLFKYFSNFSSIEVAPFILGLLHIMWNACGRVWSRFAIVSGSRWLSSVRFDIHFFGKRNKMAPVLITSVLRHLGAPRSSQFQYLSQIFQKLNATYRHIRIHQLQGYFKDLHCIKLSSIQANHLAAYTIRLSVFVCWLHLLNQLTNTQDIGTSYI
jgi:hypothetical protein